MSNDAIPASTLVVMRDRPDGPPDLLTVTRGQGMTFAAGAIVFPGGRIDPEDALLGADWPFEDSAARVAAVRETLEESGIPAGLVPLPSPASTVGLQESLHAGAPFSRLLAEVDAELDLDALVPFTRWMPSFKHARVFDTMFYLICAPEGNWTPRFQPGECEAVEWMSAAEALVRIDAGRATAIFPTKRNLERLAQFASFDEAAADARRHPVELITPWIEEREGEKHVVIPEGLGYPVTSELLATAFRA